MLCLKDHIQRSHRESKPIAVSLQTWNKRSPNMNTFPPKKSMDTLATLQNQPPKKWYKQVKKSSIQNKWGARLGDHWKNLTSQNECVTPANSKVASSTTIGSQTKTLHSKNESETFPISKATFTIRKETVISQHSLCETLPSSPGTPPPPRKSKTKLWIPKINLRPFQFQKEIEKAQRNAR